MSWYHSVNLPAIDLHTFHNTTDALSKLEIELFLFYKKGIRQCRVIHGIGEGIMAAAVHEAMTKNPLVKKLEEEQSGGSCVVFL